MWAEFLDRDRRGATRPAPTSRTASATVPSSMRSTHRLPRAARTRVAVPAGPSRHAVVGTMTTLDRDRAATPAPSRYAWPIPTDESARAVRARRAASRRAASRARAAARSPYPLFMTRAQGSRIWDVDGNEFVDFHSSFGAVLLGHNDPRINAAVVARRWTSTACRSRPPTRSRSSSPSGSSR